MFFVNIMFTTAFSKTRLFQKHGFFKNTAFSKTRLFQKTGFFRSKTDHQRIENLVC